MPVVMIDGIHFRGRVVLVALGFDTAGKKHVLGIREGSTEKTQVVRALLSELIDRGLDADRTRLWVIDGGKALRRALTEVFGASALVQRCQEHKRRNVLEHLPDEMHASVGRALADAWHSKDAVLAKRQLERLGNSLAKDHPGRRREPARRAGRDAHGDRLRPRRGAVSHVQHDQSDREPERTRSRISQPT